MKKQVEDMVEIVRSPREGNRILGRWIKITPRPSRHFIRKITSIEHWITECLHDVECEGKKVTVTLEIE